MECDLLCIKKYLRTRSLCAFRFYCKRQWLLVRANHLAIIGATQIPITPLFLLQGANSKIFAHSRHQLPCQTDFCYPSSLTMLCTGTKSNVPICKQIMELCLIKRYLPRQQHLLNQISINIYKRQNTHEHKHGKSENLIIG